MIGAIPTFRDEERPRRGLLKRTSRARQAFGNGLVGRSAPVSASSVAIDQRASLRLVRLGLENLGHRPTRAKADRDGGEHSDDQHGHDDHHRKG